jgi:hypothetical protein
MNNRLLIFGSFAHHAQGVLAAIGQLALVGVERGLDCLWGIALELGIAAFAYSEQGRLGIYDSQSAFSHAASLAHGE